MIYINDLEFEKNRKKIITSMIKKSTEKWTKNKTKNVQINSTIRSFKATKRKHTNNWSNTTHLYMISRSTVYIYYVYLVTKQNKNCKQKKTYKL